MPEWLLQIDHTGDAGFQICAGSEAELFERAAWAMFDFLADLDRVEPVATDSVEVEAADRDALLVRWLSELNYRHITEHRLYCEFRILEWQPHRIRAEVRGEEISSKRHVVHTEIKAVTFHGLEIVETDHGFRLQVIFDL